MKNRKQFICMMMTVVLMLTGCGQRTEKQQSQTIEPLQKYTAEYYTLEEVLEPETEEFYLASGAFYHILEEEGRSVLYRRELAEAEQRSREVLSFAENENPLLFVVTEAGEVIAVLNRFALTEEGETDYGIYPETFLCKYDRDGSLLWELALTEELYPNALHVDGQGRIYAATNEKVYIYDADGNRQGQFSVSNVFTMASVSSGEIFLSNGMEVAVYTESKGKTEDVTALTGFRLFHTGEDIVLCKENYLYTYVPGQDEAPVKCVNLLEYYVNAIEVVGVAVKDGEISILCRKNLRSRDVELTILRPEGAESAKFGDADSKEDRQNATAAEKAEDTPKIPLEMAVLNARNWGELVIDFNRASSTVSVTLVPMSGANIDEMQTQMDTSLLSQNPPDIIELAGGPLSESYYRYAENEYLMDLVPYIENSEVLSQSDFVNRVLEDFTIDGKIYAIPALMEINTIICSTEAMSGKTNWTIEEYLVFLEQNPNAFSQKDDGYTDEHRKSLLLDNVLWCGMDAFMDREAGKAYFDGERFKNVLRRIHELEFTEVTESQEERILAGEILAVDVYNLYDNRCFANEEWLLAHGKGVTIMGYPTAEAEPGGGGVSLIGYVNILAISATCEHPEEAWKVIERHLLQQALSAENKHDVMGFATGKDGLEECLKEGTEERYEEMPMGEIAYLSVEYGKDYPIVITPEQVEKVRRALENSIWIDEEIDAFLPIIQEEAMAYFEGQKTLDAAVDVIQNRIQLYLDEQG